MLQVNPTAVAFSSMRAAVFLPLATHPNKNTLLSERSSMICTVSNRGVFRVRGDYGKGLGIGLKQWSYHVIAIYYVASKDERIQCDLRGWVVWTSQSSL